MDKKIRILIAKAGLDGHDRGAKVVAATFRDAGFEVIYTGLRQTPEMIVQAAVEEDVNVIALSILSGAHMTVFPKVLKLMKQYKIDDVLLTGGGIIADEEIKNLMGMGVGRLFGPGSPLGEAVEYVKDWYKKHHEN
ncbi:MAG: cobalamin B12-binding domain-containing protein [Calditrichales bacterium]|nr:cobalamin B12-binding domain-containing protein [Calditrichales bacterium]